MTTYTDIGVLVYPNPRTVTLKGEPEQDVNVLIRDVLVAGLKHLLRAEADHTEQLIFGWGQGSLGLRQWRWLNKRRSCSTEHKMQTHVKYMKQKHI